MQLPSSLLMHTKLIKVEQFSARRQSGRQQMLTTARPLQAHRGKTADAKTKKKGDRSYYPQSS